MKPSLSSIGFGVEMTVTQFLKMDTFDYDTVIGWFPPSVGVISLNWDGHFGPQLIFNCEVEDVAEVVAIMEMATEVLKAKLTRQPKAKKETRP